MASVLAGDGTGRGNLVRHPQSTWMKGALLSVTLTTGRGISLSSPAEAVTARDASRPLPFNSRHALPLFCRERLEHHVLQAAAVYKNVHIVISTGVWFDTCLFFFF